MIVLLLKSLGGSWRKAVRKNTFFFPSCFEVIASIERLISPEIETCKCGNFCLWRFSKLLLTVYKLYKYMVYVGVRVCIRKKERKKAFYLFISTLCLQLDLATCCICVRVKIFLFKLIR